jgi:mono/diheme cytochrome c family protein
MMVSLGRGVTLRCVLGAALSLACSLCAAAEEEADPPTYCEHVAPILWKHCADCHRPGEVGMFPLLTYQDAAKRASFLMQVVDQRRMPPWKPHPGFGQFKDVRRMSDEEIDILLRWVAAEAPQGDPAKLPPAPKFCEGWHLGEPDLVVAMREPFEIPADGRDVYRCFVIPLGLSEDRTVSAVEFRPGNRGVVHHSIMFLDANGEARKLDGADGQPGYRSFGGAGVMPTGGLGAWLPGTVPRHLPAGHARYVRKGSDLVLQVHYHPSGKVERDRSRVGIYFTKQPVEKIITGIAVTQPALVLPAGKPRCVVRARSRPLPVNVSVLAVSPHMHFLGREFKVSARLPAGGYVPLVWIKDWDVNWQGSYEFASPIRLPQESVICVEAIYDNSAANPLNPHNPPREVRWGEQTTDEMCLCGLQVCTEKTSDLAAIAEMPGFELAAGLEGGVPLDETRAPTPRELVAKRRSQQGGIPIFQDDSRLMIPYDENKNGWLSPDEMSKMSTPMQSYLLKKYRRGQ